MLYNNFYCYNYVWWFWLHRGWPQSKLRKFTTLVDVTVVPFASEFSLHRSSKPLTASECSFQTAGLNSRFKKRRRVDYIAWGKGRCWPVITWESGLPRTSHHFKGWYWWWQKSSAHPPSRLPCTQLQHLHREQNLHFIVSEATFELTKVGKQFVKDGR